MKYITKFLLLFISLNALAGSSINFEKNMNWAAIKAKALKENKMIFFDAYTSWCGPCKYLESSVYTNAVVASYYNENFINVKFDMEAGEGIQLAEEFDISAYPTLLFFSPEGKLVHKNIGALAVTEFLDLGKDAKDPAKQYYTLKQKVIEKKVSTDDFLEWTKMADGIQDKSRGAVASSWLSGQSDILANEELAKATLLYTDVTEEQLAYLYQQKGRISQLLNWDNAKTAATLFDKLFALALKDFDVSSRNTSYFISVIKKFEPGQLNYALKKLEIVTALKLDDNQEKAVQEIISSLKGIKKISLKETAKLLFAYITHFDETGIKQLSAGLGSYTLTSADKGNEGWIFLMQAVCYSILGEETTATALAKKATENGCLPNGYQHFLKGVFGSGE